jgi:hypothetical protein
MKLYPMYHKVCGKISFYTKQRLVDMIDPWPPNAKDVILLDGTQPLNYIDELFCDSCKTLSRRKTWNEFYYKSNEPIDVDFIPQKTYTSKEFNELAKGDPLKKLWDEDQEK